MTYPNFFNVIEVTWPAPVIYVIAMDNIQVSLIVTMTLSVRLRRTAIL